jgi:hypothetical protein
MQITIKTLTGKVEQIQLGSTASVCELTQQVEECFGVPAEEQKLIFNGMKWLTLSLRINQGLRCLYGC